MELWCNYYSCWCYDALSVIEKNDLTYVCNCECKDCIFSEES